MRRMDTTHFWLIRHGETEWNANRRLQGWLDVPLSDTGRRQARQLRTYLQGLNEPAFSAVLTSDLSRAADTAQIAAGHLGLPIVRTPALRERNYGVYQGMDWAALTEGLGTQGIDLRAPDQPIENGETFAEFAARIAATFQALAREYAGQHVLAFSHGGVVDIAWRKAGGHALTVKRPGTILNTSINVFNIRGDGVWRQGMWNQVEHLDLPALDDVMHT